MKALVMCKLYEYEISGIYAYFVTCVQWSGLKVGYWFGKFGKVRNILYIYSKQELHSDNV